MFNPVVEFWLSKTEPFLSPKRLGFRQESRNHAESVLCAILDHTAVVDDSRIAFYLCDTILQKPG